MGSTAHAAGHDDHSDTPPFFRRWFLSTNHKDIGTLYLLFAMMAGLMRETIVIGEALGFKNPGDVDAQLGFFRDKPTRPSMLQDFELGREPELVGSILAVAGFARAAEIRAPLIETVATLLRCKAAGVRLRRPAGPAS